MTGDTFETYDFLINDEDEAMLLLYVREGEPQNAVIEIDTDKKTALLHRRPGEEVTLDDIPDDVLDSIAEADKLLICELSIEDNDEDTQIVYAYEAEIND